MTATSRARRSPMRLLSMESLGFFDPPEQTWTAPPASAVDPAIVHETTQTTELFEIPVGKHTRQVEPTGDLVTDMWQTTELHAPSLLDWEPQTASTWKLGRRDFRWPVVLLVVAGAIGVAALGLWAYNRPAGAASEALALVSTEASLLAEALDQSEPLIANLDAERLPEASQASTVPFDMDEAARAMFAASADLPEADSVDRAAAAEAAGLSLDSSRRLVDATAFRTALEPALTLPILETDPALTDLTTATAAFTEWRAGFEAVHDALPTDVASLASGALDTLSAELGTVQTAYLDALRLGDRAAAVAAIGNLKADLLEVRSAMLADMSEIAATVAGLVEDARASLAPLLG